MVSDAHTGVIIKTHRNAVFAKIKPTCKKTISPLFKLDS